MGLGKIFLFSVFAGLSFAFSYKASGDTPEVGGFVFVILDLLSQYGDSEIQGLVIIISIVITIFSIYGLSVFLRQVIEERLVGILTAIVGFLGSFLILSTQEAHFIVIGVSLWIVGIVLASLFGKKKS